MHRFLARHPLLSRHRSIYCDRLRYPVRLPAKLVTHHRRAKGIPAVALLFHDHLCLRDLNRFLLCLGLGDYFGGVDGLCHGFRFSLDG